MNGMLIKDSKSQNLGPQSLSPSHGPCLFCRPRDQRSGLSNDQYLICQSHGLTDTQILRLRLWVYWTIQNQRSCVYRVFAQRSDYWNFSDMIRDMDQKEKEPGIMLIMGLMEQSEEFKMFYSQFTERHVDRMDRIDHDKMFRVMKSLHWIKHDQNNAQIDQVINKLLILVLVNGYISVSEPLDRDRVKFDQIHSIPGPSGSIESEDPVAFDFDQVEFKCSKETTVGVSCLRKNLRTVCTPLKKCVRWDIGITDSGSEHPLRVVRKTVSFIFS